MLQIVYFDQKDQVLSHLESKGDQIQYITPSPGKADGLRTLLSGPSDVITIAKFTSNLLELLWLDEADAPQVKRKSELLLIMGVMKNKFFSELGYEQFIQAWNLFSDLRSFTLDYSALASVMESQPEVIQQLVKVFWAILETGQYCDEHGAYQAIAEKLRSCDEEDSLKKTYVFWGFQHLNGQQVDLLKALAIRYDVVVPFPRELKDHLRRSDWPLWLKDHRTIETDLDPFPLIPKGSKYIINSREIASSLKTLMITDAQVILGVSKLKPSHINILPFSGVSFKIPHEILSDEILSISALIEDKIGEDCSSDKVFELLQELRTQSLVNNRAPFKLLRTIQLFEEALRSIQSQTSESLHVDEFYRKLLRDVSLLNQPRTSFVPLDLSESTMELRDMSSLESIPNDTKVILCIDERFEDIQSLGQNYTEAIQKELSSIGPLKRNELELLFKQLEFRSLFSRTDVSVLIPPEVLKHNLIWKRLFDGVIDCLEDKNLPQKGERPPLEDHLARHPKKKFSGHFSASSLQNYQDCPQKFYFNYVEDFSPDVTVTSDVDSMLSGTISHKVIELAHERKISPENLSEVTSEVFGVYIKKNHLKLSQEVYDKHHLVFRQRAENGLRFLRSLEDHTNEKISWVMEKDFKPQENFNFKGKIDCIGVSDKRIYLIDFKSSKGSAAEPGEILSFEALQLWVYSLAAQKFIPDFEKKEIVIGYVVLKSPEDSILMSSDEFFELEFSRVSYFKEPFSEILGRAEDHIKSQSMKALQESEFFARPSSKDVCLYCYLARICTKGAVSV